MVFLSSHRRAFMVPLLCLVFCLPGICQESGLDATPAEVAVLVEQLDGDRYEVRKNARQSLIRIGAAAIEPIEAAIVQNVDNRELQTQGLKVLESLVFEGAPDVKQAASDSLVRIVMTDTSSSATRIANRVLATYAQAATRKAKEELRKLGAQLQGGVPVMQLGQVAAGEDVTQAVRLAEKWRGQPDDLQRLKLLPQLKSVTLVGPRITDSYLDVISEVDTVEAVEIREAKVTARGLGQLGRLDSLQTLSVRNTNLVEDGDIVSAVASLKATRVRLITTGIDDETVGKLIALIPSTKMELHFGAFLGVGPVQPVFDDQGEQVKQCELGLVSPDSAADKAGLRENDIITKYDDKPITHFEQLREYIGQHTPGRVVKIEIQRAGKTIVKEVTLGEIQ